MRLLYYKSAHGNFGDDINVELWPALAPELFDEAGDQDGFLGIGTVIGMPVQDVRRTHVFTSGVGYNNFGRLQTPHRFWAVRGPLSARVLGLGSEVAITDGALLATDLYLKRDGERGVVVVPHWESLLIGGWREACQLAGFELIDPTEPPEAVLPKLASAKLVLTESLHGAIFADAYGVPWIAFSSTRSFSTFKWLDWTQTVETPLRPVLIPPPSALAAVKLGRPRGGHWGAQLQPSEAELSEDVERLRTQASLAPSGAAGLSSKIKTFAAAHPVISAALGYSPARTAEHLAAMAKLPNFQSRASVRERLRDQLSERFRQLCAEAGVSSRL